MKHLSKFFALLMILVLLMTGCGNGTSKYATTVAATYGNKTIYLDEANFWLRFEQLGYSLYIYYYAQLGISDFWGSQSNNRSQTMEESLKEQVMAEFLQLNVLLDHADEFGVSLTNEDYKKIDDAIALIHTSYGDTLFTEQVLGSYTDEQIRASIAERSKALKVWDAVREQAAVNVADAEADSFTVNYFLISSSSSVTPADQTDALTGEAAATYLAEQLKSGKSFSDLKTTYSSLTANTASYRWNDTESQTSNPQNSIGRTLQDGESTMQASGSYWYVVEMVSSHDADATAAAKAELESEQKEAHFKEAYAEWAKAAKSFSVKSAFNDLPITLD